MPLRSPLRNLEKPRSVLAWGMFDLANQSFQLLINTLLFSVYFESEIVGDPSKGRAYWGALIFMSNAVVVALSPFLGAYADRHARRKLFLISSGFTCVALMLAFPLLRPGMIVLAALAYIPAAIACGLGENFLGAFLPDLAKRDQMGRVSAIGWSMSYIGALLLLAISAIAVFAFDLDQPRQWRWLFWLAAAWFAIGILPALFILKEPRATPRTDAAQQLRPGALASRLRAHRDLARFFLAFFVYSMGTQTVVFFAALIAGSFGFAIREQILMALVMALTAGAAAITTGIFQDRLGHLRTIRVILAVWIASTLALACMSVPALHLPRSAFWPIAAGIGLGLGGVGTASRALVGAFTPEERAAEFFGFWGMTYKLASIGGLAFGIVSSKIPGGGGVFLIAAFFIAGYLLLYRVNERAGMAKAAEPPDAPRCPKCGYNLTGVAIGVCPECGAHVQPA